MVFVGPKLPAHFSPIAPTLDLASLEQMLVGHIGALIKGLSHCKPSFGRKSACTTVCSLSIDVDFLQLHCTRIAPRCIASQHLHGSTVQPPQTFMAPLRFLAALPAGVGLRQPGLPAGCGGGGQRDHGPGFLAVVPVVLLAGRCGAGAVA